MMKIPTETVLTDFEHKPLETKDGVLTLGVALSSILINAEKGGKTKMFIMAQKAYEHRLEVDKADMALIKDATEDSKAFNNLVLGQIALRLEEVKDEEDSK